MKVLLLLVVSCFALHNGTGAPATAVYKFVTCNPKDGQANCVTRQSAEVEWTPELPAKLPASAAQRLESTPVEDEHPDREENGEKEPEQEQPMSSDEGESPSDEGSGTDLYDSWYADQSDYAGTEAGSGMEDKGEDMRSHVFRRSLHEEDKPVEQALKDEHLLF